MKLEETKAQTIEQQIVNSLKTKLNNKFSLLDINNNIIVLKFNQIPTNITEQIPTKFFLFNLVNVDHVRNTVTFNYTKIRSKNKSGLIPTMKGYFKHRYKQDFRIFKTPKDKKKIIVTLKNKNNDISNKLRSDIGMIFKVFGVKDWSDVNFNVYINKKNSVVTNRQIILDESVWTIFLKQISLVK